MILMYHNVWPNNGPVGHQYQGITLLARQFERQINLLNRFFEILPMAEYLQRTPEQRKKRNELAVTFDDGTGITYEVAGSILSKRDIPATFFVSTCQLDSGPLIWGGYLNALCFEDGYDEVEYADRVYGLRSGPERRVTRTELTRLAIESGDPRQFAAELGQRYPLSKDVIPYYCGMTSEQVREAAASPLFQVGAHSVHHYSLSNLDSQSMTREIVESGQVLELLTGQQTKYFAYPSGDYDARTIECLKDNGYSAGFAVRTKGLTTSADYEIPRVGAYGTTKLVVKLGTYRLGLAFQECAL